MRWLIGSALLATSCGTAGMFECQEDEACRTDGVAGRCEASGLCSFPDDGCPNGRRYGAHAGVLAHECVTDRDDDASSTGPTSPTGDGSADGIGTSDSTTASSLSSSTSVSDGTSEGESGTTLAEGTMSSTDATDASSSNEASSTEGELRGCIELYGDLADFVLCEEGPTTCQFQVSTNRQSCATLCEAQGGSCIDGWDDGIGVCEISDVETGGCDRLYFEQICLCTREP